MAVEQESRQVLRHKLRKRYYLGFAIRGDAPFKGDSKVGTRKERRRFARALAARDFKNREK